MTDDPEKLKAIETANIVRLHQDAGDRQDMAAAIRRAASRRPSKET